MCEGEDYIQLRFHDNHFGKYENPTLASFATFQNPQGSNKPHSADHLYNSYFNNNQTINGTEYCFTNSEIGDLNSTCVNSYDANLAQNGSHFTFIPLGSDSAQKNVLLPSDIKQSYRSGLGSEFIWMNLDKDPTILSYTPPANNASGFGSGANDLDGVSGPGSVAAGSEVTHTTANDEIVIAGEVYTAAKLQTFLNGTKKVVAYAPIPILHTNKYELEQYEGESDVRFRRTHTIMPSFISSDYMESQDNGTDANFDFHQLRDNDHCKTNISCIIYNTDGGNSFNSQDGSVNTKTETHIDGMYGYAAKALDENISVSSERFGDLADNADFVPIGQSLWYQVYNPTGRGVGLYAQLNWSCGTGKPCGEWTNNKSGAPHNSQQSLFSVLVVDSGDKSDFALDGNYSGYSASSTGTVIDGSHYWSYKRRDGRTIETDGEYAGAQKATQVAFGINPIACVSGPDNGCFLETIKKHSSTIGAPSTVIITTSDPCSSFGLFLKMDVLKLATENMELGVMYSMEANDSNAIDRQNYKRNFYQGITHQTIQWDRLRRFYKFKWFKQLAF